MPRVTKHGLALGSLAASAAIALAACATALDLHEVDYAAVEAGGDVRDTEGGGMVPETKPDAGVAGEPCDVGGDGKLSCGNRANSPLRSAPTLTAPIVDILRTETSIFLCWGTGDPHAGGNATWYYTNGDDQHRFGWLPAVALETPDAFDENPTARGLRRCDR